MKTPSYLIYKPTNPVIAALEARVKIARARLEDVKARRKTNFRGVGLFCWLDYNERVTQKCV